MSNTLTADVTELRTKIASEKDLASKARSEAEALVASEKAAGRNPLTGTTDDDRDSFKRIDAAYKVGDEHAQTAAELEERLHRVLDQAGAEARDQSGGDPDHPSIARVISLGEVAAESDEYGKFLASGQLENPPSTVSFSPVQVLSRRQAREFLATGTYTAAAGDGTPLIPTDDRTTPVMLARTQMLSVLELISVRNTQRDAVTWRRQTARTTAGTTTVPFGTALNESAYTFEKVTSPVLRKGHYAVVDEGNIADSEEFAGIVDDELVVDLRQIVETDIMSGAGGADWTGVYNTAGITAIDGTGVTRADALHQAITQTRLALGMDPTGWGIGPVAFEEFYLEKGTDGHYLHHRGTLEGGPRTIWGIPASVSTVFNTAPIVGHWQRGAVLWVRDGISVAVDRINNQFLTGEWTVRAQTRGAFAVQRPFAFGRVNNYGTP